MSAVSPFKSLPREISSMINRNLVSMPKGIKFVVFKNGNAPYSKENNVAQLFRIEKYVGSDHYPLKEALAAFRAIRQVSKQLASEMTEDFFLFNPVTILEYGIFTDFDNDPAPHIPDSLCEYFTKVTIVGVDRFNWSTAYRCGRDPGVELKMTNGPLGIGRIIQEGVAFSDNETSLSLVKQIKHRVGSKLRMEDIKRAVLLLSRRDVSEE